MRVSDATLTTASDRVQQSREAGEVIGDAAENGGQGDVIRRDVLRGIAEVGGRAARNSGVIRVRCLFSARLEGFRDGGGGVSHRPPSRSRIETDAVRGRTTTGV